MKHNFAFRCPWQTPVPQRDAKINVLRNIPGPNVYAPLDLWELMVDLVLVNRKILFFLEFFNQYF